MKNLLFVLIIALITVFTVSCDHEKPESLKYRLEITGDCNYYCINNKIIVTTTFQESGKIYINYKKYIRFSIIKLSNSYDYLDCTLYIDSKIVKSIIINDSFEEHILEYIHY